jgi:5-methylcytosine-specific restriction endonuclease McrA
MKKTLLLSNSYQYNAIIDERHAIKLLFKNKVEIVCTWEDYQIKWINNSILNFPAILRLNTAHKQHYKTYHFNRDVIVKRDNSTCQYCSRALSKSDITIDHIIPKCKGGKSNFYNCVICCKSCNGLKSHQSLEECGLKLIKTPGYPGNLMKIAFDEALWHKDWKMFLQ